MAEQELVIASLLLRIEQLEDTLKLRKKNIIGLKRYLDDALAQLSAQMATLSTSLSQLPDSSAIADRQSLDNLKFQFNNRPEIQQLANLQTDLAQTQAQISFLQQRFDQLPDVSTIVALPSLDLLRTEFNNRPEIQQLKSLQVGITQLSEEITDLKHRFLALPDYSTLASSDALDELRFELDNRPGMQQISDLQETIAHAASQISTLQRRFNRLPDFDTIAERYSLDELRSEFDNRPEIQQLPDLQETIAHATSQISALQSRFNQLPDFNALAGHQTIDELRYQFNTRPELQQLPVFQEVLTQLFAQITSFQQRLDQLENYNKIAAPRQATAYLEQDETSYTLTTVPTSVDFDEIMPISAEEFLQRVREGERDFTGINLSGVNLSKTSLTSHVNLSKANLSCANLNLVNWSNLNLSGANLSGANISEADLSKANLSEANLDNANLEGTKLESAQLEKATLKNANLSKAALYGEANLSGANLSGANLSKANLRQAKLIKAQLNNANLSKAKIIDANLKEASLQGVNLRQAVYNPETIFPQGFNATEVGAYSIAPGAVLRNADLAGVNLSNVNLTGADLQGASLKSTNLENANLNEANLSRADLSKANLQNAQLVQANLCEASLSQACLNNANLTGAILSNANLIQASLQAANLTAADLSKANLRNAELDDYFHATNLSVANLSGANLLGVSLNQLNLNGANLSGANLCGASLSGTSLVGANLTSTDLRGANLGKANLQKANLKNANLSGANLSRVNLNGAIMPDGSVYN